MRRMFLKLFRRWRLERDLQAEMTFHRELAAAAGNPVPFGNPAAIADEARDVWRFVWFENLWRDVAYGARGLARQPALVTSAVLSLALGVGANATVFSLGMELLLSEPSVTDASSLVYVRDGGNSHTSPANVDIVRQSGLFADVAAQREEASLNWNDGQETRSVAVMATTKNFFSTVGMPVALGRGIAPTDPDEVAVLAHHFWSRHFGSDPGIVGRAITLDGRPFTVIGVLPAATRTLVGYGYAPDLYVPRFSKTAVLAMYARLKPGMSVDQTRAAVRAFGQGTDSSGTFPTLKLANLRLSSIAGLRRLRDEPQALTVAAFFLVVLTVMALVLLLACVNVAGLLLSRGAVRRRELTLRVALGASRARLLQQLLVESVLLALGGAMVGIALTEVLGRRLSTLQLPLPLPILLHAEPDWRVVSYAALLATAATLTCGIVPALQSVRESLAPELHRERRLRLRRTLLAGQVAVSFVVIAVALIFVRNLAAAASMSPGFDTRQTIRATASLSGRSYDTSTSIKRYTSRALAVLQSLPGIEAAAAVRSLPFNDRSTRGHDVTWSDSGEKTAVSYGWNAVTPDYFKAMSIPVRQGRPFAPTDESGDRVVVVNQIFVDRYLKGRPAVGSVYVVAEDPLRSYQIVGVVDSVKTLTLGEEEHPQLYELLPQLGSTRERVDFVLRTTGAPAAHLKVVQDALRDIDPGVGLEVSTLRSAMALAFLPSQAGAAFMSTAGVLGLLLVAIGLFGTMAFSVTQRTREIGVRMAIGATRADVVRMVVADCAWVLITGTVFGAVTAWFVTQPLSAFLVPGLSPNDPPSFALVFVVMAMTGLVATWTPARRAAAIDPAVSLRAE